jgi:hypothetical protein
MSAGSGSSRTSRYANSMLPSQAMTAVSSISSRVGRTSTLPSSATISPAPVSVSPLIGSPMSVGSGSSGIAPTSSLLVSQLLAGPGGVDAMDTAAAGATPFGMIVVGDKIAQSDLAKEKQEELTNGQTESSAETSEHQNPKDINEVSGNGLSLPNVPGYEDLRPIYSIVRFLS